MIGIESQSKSVFETLNSINVNSHTERKNGLTYLSWAWAWAEIKKAYPEATYTIYENADGLFYHTDGKTAWVKTGVTVEGLEMIEYLPVMDYKNKSIPVDSLTSFDVNKAIQRSLTKACARHGLGLYIYAGEDLPTEAKKEEEPIQVERFSDLDFDLTCEKCGGVILPHTKHTAQEIAEKSKKQFGQQLCWDCAKEAKAAAK